MSFPHRTNLPLFVYTIRVPGTERVFDAFTREDLLLALTDEGGRYHTVLGPDPASWDHSTKEPSGWYWLDEERTVPTEPEPTPADLPGPILVNEYAAWGLREYKKKVPPSLKKKTIEQKLRAYKKETGGHAPAEVRKMIREEVTDELTRRAQPAIVESSILIDQKRGVLYLFNASGPARRAMLTRIKYVLERVYGAVPEVAEVNLLSYLLTTRPGAVLPGDLGRRFLSWLTRVALTTPWVSIPVDGQPKEKPIVFCVELSDHVAIDLGADGKLQVRGDSAAAELAKETMANEEADEDEDGESVNARHVSQLRIRISNADYEKVALLRVDADAVVLGCRLLNASNDASGHDLHTEAATVLMRASDLAFAYDFWILVLDAFNRGHLQEWMDDGVQTQMWPGTANGQATFAEYPPEKKRAVRGPLL